MADRIIRIVQRVKVLDLDTPIAAFVASPQAGMRVEYDSTGIQILLDGHLICAGSWELQNGGDLAGASPDATEAQLGAVQSMTISSSRSDTVKIKYVYAHFEVSQTWLFSAEDIVISSAVTNKSDPLPLKMARFGALTFHFAADLTPSKSTGIFPSIEYHALQALGEDLMHPSGFTILGVAYAQDGSFGVALHTRTHLLQNKFFNATFTGNNIIPKDSVVSGYYLDEIATGATVVFDTRLRISRELTLDSKGRPTHLLGAYKTDFDAATGGIQYTPDDRAIAKFSAAEAAYVRVDNPYGYGDLSGTALWVRFDHDNSTSDGVRGYDAQVGPPVQSAGGQGAILWNPQGYDPRGAAYRADFDIWPPEPASHRAVLVGAFAARNLRIGLAGRPGEFVERLNYTNDTHTKLDADNQAQMTRLLGRFAAMATVGFNLWYFDSFGWTLNDYKIMKAIRAQLGPSVPTYSEQGSDIFMTLSSRFTQHVGGGFPNISADIIDILRWLVPDATWLCQPLDGTTIDQLGQQKFTPILEDSLWDATLVAQIQVMQSAYQSGTRWK